MTNKKVTLTYVDSNATNYKEYADNPGFWELTVTNDVINNETVRLPHDIAMTVAFAITTAKEVGIEQGMKEAKKKYDAMNKAASSYPGYTQIVETDAIDDYYTWRYNG